MSRARWSTRVLLAWIVTFVVSTSIPVTASAQEQPGVYELHRDIPTDLAVTAGAAALLFTSEVFKDHLAPQQCRWCDKNGEGDDVLNPLDRGMRALCKWDNTRPARKVADVNAFILTPSASIATMMLASIDSRAEGKYPTDMLFVLEAVMVAGVLNQGMKLLVARERPFLHAMNQEEKLKQPHLSDNNLSFYSGHTSFSFAVATASGTIATLRDYDLKAAVWATLLPLATLTAYLRIAGDRHYFLDVLTGAVLGSAVGVLVPLVFHGREARETPLFSNAASAPPATPAVMSFTGAF